MGIESTAKRPGKWITVAESDGAARPMVVWIGGFDGKLNHCIGRVSGRGKSSPWTWILYQVAFAVQPEQEEFVVNGICAFVVGYEVFIKQ